MPEDLYAQALARFTAHDDASRSRMEFKSGALEFLEAAVTAGIPVAIVTGTPQEVIEKTVAYFRLEPFFKRVCGTPGSKAAHLERMLREFTLKAERCLFAGDAIKDQEAAVAVGMPFAGVNNGDDPFRAEGLTLEIKGPGRVNPVSAPVGRPTYRSPPRGKEFLPAPREYNLPFRTAFRFPDGFPADLFSVGLPTDV